MQTLVTSYLKVPLAHTGSHVQVLFYPHKSPVDGQVSTHSVEESKAYQWELFRVGQSKGVYTHVLFTSSLHVSWSHVWTQYLFGKVRWSLWAYQSIGHTFTHLNEIWSPKVFYASGHYFTHRLVELSANLRVPSANAGQIATHTP